MINKNDKVAICCYSNLREKNEIDILKCLEDKLKDLGVKVVLSKFIFKEDKLPCAKTKAEELMSFYLDKEVKAIFDISGGDIANEVLPFLDYNVIKDNYKPFFGYSDLTTILNALYKKTNNKQILYQVKNIVLKDSIMQEYNFKESIINDKPNLFNISYEFLRGEKAEGILIGGNIRCLLKLAGTQYMPNFNKKILFLESRSGEENEMKAFFNQLKQMNVFNEISALLLGTFTMLEKNKENKSIYDIVKSIIDNESIPIIKTKEVGHNDNSKALIIGGKYIFNKGEMQYDN